MKELEKLIGTESFNAIDAWLKEAYSNMCYPGLRLLLVDALDHLVVGSTFLMAFHCPYGKGNWAVMVKLDNGTYRDIWNDEKGWL